LMARKPLKGMMSFSTTFICSTHALYLP
jgi:hypothetical protein